MAVVRLDTVGNWSDAQKGAAAVAASIVAVGAAAAAAVAHLVNVGGKFTDLSARTGIATKDLQAFAVAGKLVGVGVEDVAKGMQKFQRELVEGSAKTRAALQTLGLSVKELQTMSAGDQMSTVLKAISELEDPAQRTAIAVELLGKSGAALVPLGASFDEIRAKAEAMGIIMREEVVAAADDLGDSIDMLGLAAEGVSNNFAAAIVTSGPLHALIEGLTDIMGQLSLIVRDNEGTIRSWVDGGVILMANALVGAANVTRIAVEVFKFLADVWVYAKRAAMDLAAGITFLNDLRKAPTEAAAAWQRYNAELTKNDAALRANLAGNEQAFAGARDAAETVYAAMDKLRDSVEAQDGAMHRAAESTGRKREADLAAAEAAIKHKDAIDRLLASANRNLVVPGISSVYTTPMMHNTINDRVARDLLTGNAGGAIRDVTAQTRQVRLETINWSRALQDVANMMQVLGVSSESTLGRVIGLATTAASAVGNMMAGGPQGWITGITQGIGVLGSVVGMLSGDGAQRARQQKNKAREDKEVGFVLAQHEKDAAAAAGAQEALNEAMDRYGLEAADMGMGFQQMNLDEQALELFKFHQVLIEGGARMELVNERMSADMSAYVNQAIAAGATIPKAMEPILVQMAREGQLLKENGEAYTEEEAKGLNYAETMVEAFQRVADMIERLVEHFTGIPTEKNLSVNVHTRYTSEGVPGPAGGGGDPGAPDPLPDESFAVGTGGLRYAERDKTIGVHGGETYGVWRQGEAAGGTDMSEVLAELRQLPRKIARATVARRALATTGR
jgi:hypothetical protein